VERLPSEKGLSDREGRYAASYAGRNSSVGKKWLKTQAGNEKKKGGGQGGKKKICPVIGGQSKKKRPWVKREGRAREIWGEKKKKVVWRIRPERRGEGGREGNLLSPFLHKGDDGGGGGEKKWRGVKGGSKAPEKKEFEVRNCGKKNLAGQPCPWRGGLTTLLNTPNPANGESQNLGPPLGTKKGSERPPPKLRKRPSHHMPRPSL